MRILVTGASGYIGRHLIPKLREAGYEVLPVYRAQERGGGGWNSDYTAVYADLSDAGDGTHFGDVQCLPLPEHEFVKPPQVVIHLAGRVEINLQPNPKGAHLPPVPGPCDIGALYRDNVVATANVLDYCLKAEVKHLIFASTQAVYGMYSFDARGFLTSQPLEHYAASKRAAEHLLDIGRTQGLRIDTLRLPGIFGGDRKRGAVYLMCRDALTKGVVNVTAPYPLPIQVLHIEDLVTAFQTILSWTPEPIAERGLTFDVTLFEPCSLTLLAEEITRLVPGCTMIPPATPQPVVPHPHTWTAHRMVWKAKPRKERLAQLLEEIRLDSGNT